MTEDARRPAWLEFVVAIVAGLIVYGVGLGLVTVVFKTDSDVNDGLVQSAFAGLAPILVFAIVVLIRIRGLAAFGFRPVERKWLIRAVLLAAACLAVIMTFDAVVAHLFPGSDDSQGTLRATAQAGFGYLLASIFFTGVLTPIGEELLFRGVITNFLQRWGPWVAIIVGAVIFALWHGINLVFPSALVAGLCFGWLFVRSGSIWPGMLMHIIYNTTFIITYSM